MPTDLTFLADVHRRHGRWDTEPFLRLTRADFCTAVLTCDLEPKIIAALGTPKPDEEIIVTFAKRKKPCP